MKIGKGARFNGHIFGLLSVICVTSTFNVDLDSRVVHTRQEDHQWFGFSVALHLDIDEGWLLVGAPKATTKQKDVVRGGAVYRCSPNIPNACQTIPFDTKGNKFVIIDGKKFDTDNKTEQWFGATVVSSGKSGRIVACAPRYVYHSPNLRRREPVGTCYVSRSSFSEFREFSPCRTNAWGYHRQGSCQAGLSAGISKDGNRLFIGAVGSWYWQGQVFSQNLLDTSDKFGTSEDSQSFDTSYMGFSTAVGEFSGDSEEDVVVGRPRGGNLKGQILLFNSSLHSLFNISGEQIGSYFGYSVAVVDLNGDKYDDIVVGAPLFNKYDVKDKSFETGRVYAFYQTKRHKFRSWDILDGKKSKGRFGLAVASLGDINKDGYGDVCIGAPYDGDPYNGENGRGIIYLYHGSKRGIKDKPTQVIKAEDINSNINTFGFSLSAGLDLDSNKYPDLLVGGYNSDSAVFFRTRPVIHLNSSISFGDHINLDSLHCSLPDTTPVPCVLLSFCFSYTGQDVPINLDIEFKLILDAEMDEPRLFFFDDQDVNKKTGQVNLQRDSVFCKSAYAYINNDIRDKLTPLVVKSSAKLVREKRQNPLVVRPILNNNKSSESQTKINIQKECGKDQICIPDIQANVSLNQDVYIIGQKKKLELDVNVFNNGEDAYEAMFYLIISELVDFVQIILPKSSEHIINCNAPSKGEANVLKCDLGNPLQSKQGFSFAVQMLARNITTVADSFDFIAIFNSTNSELNTTVHDNEHFMSVPIRVNASLNSVGISTPWNVYINDSHYKDTHVISSEQHIGPEIIHTFGFRNPAPSPILKVKVSILWPIETVKRDPLLYLIGQPQIFGGNGSCEHVPFVNEMHLQLKQNRTLNKYLERLLYEPEFSEWEVKSKNHKTRTKREAVSSQLRDFIPCGQALCIQINCTLLHLKEKAIFVSIPARLWAKTVQELQIGKLNIISHMIATVEQLPHGVDPSYISPAISTITTTAIAEVKQNWLWIIILAVCMGLLLLIVIMIILWKLGFFKRKRPQDEKNLHNNTIGYLSPKGDDAFL